MELPPYIDQLIFTLSLLLLFLLWQRLFTTQSRHPYSGPFLAIATTLLVRSLADTIAAFNSSANTTTLSLLTTLYTLSLSIPVATIFFVTQATKLRPIWLYLQSILVFALLLIFYATPNTQSSYSLLDQARLQPAWRIWGVIPSLPPIAGLMITLPTLFAMLATWIGFRKVILCDQNLSPRTIYRHLQLLHTTQIFSLLCFFNPGYPITVFLNPFFMLLLILHVYSSRAMATYEKILFRLLTLLAALLITLSSARLIDAFLPVELPPFLLQIAMILFALYLFQRLDFRVISLVGRRISAEQFSAHLEKIYSLTKQEQRIALLIWSGIQRNDVRERLGITESTLKQQLKSIYKKSLERASESRSSGHSKLHKLTVLLQKEAEKLKGAIKQDMDGTK